MISRRLFLVGSIAALLGAGALGGAAAADGKRYYFVQNVQGLSEPPPEALFEFDSHTFTNCGQTGRFGPSLSQCLSSYGSEWTDNPEHYTVNDGIQQWVVPVSGTYRIEAWGARAGRNSSRANGAYIAGDFDLERGQVLHILVGQRGTRSTTRSGYRHDGGGGGSFVATGDSYQVADPLLVAGGGGGLRTAQTIECVGKPGNAARRLPMVLRADAMARPVRHRIVALVPAQGSMEVTRTTTDLDPLGMEGSGQRVTLLIAGTQGAEVSEGAEELVPVGITEEGVAADTPVVVRVVTIETATPGAAEADPLTLARINRQLLERTLATAA